MEPQVASAAFEIALIFQRLWQCQLYLRANLIPQSIKSMARICDVLLITNHVDSKLHGLCVHTQFSTRELEMAAWGHHATHAQAGC